MRILLIEDHDDTRLGLEFFLTAEGHEVVAFDSAEAADRSTDDLKADAAILDVRLPGKAGDAFGRELVRRYPETKIVFATGEPDLARLKAAVPGCVVLQKPLDLEALAPMLRCLTDAVPLTNV